MQIDIFEPPHFNKSLLNLDQLNRLTQKNWLYVSSGKAALYHLLKALQRTSLSRPLDGRGAGGKGNYPPSKILIPIYTCSSILEPLKKLKIEPIFYDLDLEDLNPQLESLASLAQKENVKVALVSSLYGNPTNLVEMEKYAHQNNIYLIDDVAQSFSAKLNGRYVGTFGNAGFFSFSPGKATAGHLGAFFWADKEVSIKRTNHRFIHNLAYWDFYLNRYQRYHYQKYQPILKYLTKLKRFLFQYVDIYSDQIENFEIEVLGGILHEILDHGFDFRQKYHQEFINLFDHNPYFRVIKNIRGEAKPHKFTIVANDQKIAMALIRYLYQAKIYSRNGYELLSHELKYLPNAQNIDKRVIEIPIENNEDKMGYLFEKLSQFKA